MPDPSKLPRTVLVAVTAHDGGIVSVQPAKGPPRILQGEQARSLHELACDASLPEHTIEPGASSWDRAMSLAERILIDGGR